eukprot:g20786.t1
MGDKMAAGFVAVATVNLLGAKGPLRDDGVGRERARIREDGLYSLWRFNAIVPFWELFRESRGHGKKIKARAIQFASYEHSSEFLFSFLWDSV